MRLNVYIAQSGLCSRRKADVLIKKSKVKINGSIIRNFSYQVKDNDRVTVEGKELSAQEKIYLLLNKPKGVVSTFSGRFKEKTLNDIIPLGLGRVFYAGRLDKESRGLMLLTNDGGFAYRITHPKFEVEKEYIVKVGRKVESQDLPEMVKGRKEEGEFLKFKRVKKLSSYKLEVVINEGKKREIRRLLNKFGYLVTDLKRVRIGKFRLGNLKEGQIRIIKPSQSGVIRKNSIQKRGQILENCA